MTARWLFGLALAATLAAAPTIREIYPHGAQRGKTVKVFLRGDELTQGAVIRTSLTANISRLAPSKDLAKPDTELPFLIEIPKETPVGLYPIRLLTSDGMSNVVLFSVGDLPETDETEALTPKLSNGTPPEAQAISAPVLVNGALSPADIDVYSFSAKAGEKLVFEVEARRAGSAIDPAIEILDAGGAVIAKNDDGPGADVDSRMEVAFTKAGAYFVRLHDSKYSDQAQNFYRLKIGSYPFAEGMFPLGWRRGEPAEVTLLGGNLSQPLKLKPATDGKSRYVPLSVPGSASLPMMFVLGDGPETLEPETTTTRRLPEKTIVNGRIAKAGEVDRYRIAVTPGQHWLFELAAASLGSPLDALLTAYDEKGKKLASRDDIASSDPAVPLLIPEGVREITLAVEDLLGRGGAGFAYRLQARREPADFVLEIASPFVNVPAGGTAQIAVAMQRRGYNGPVSLLIPNLPPGFQIGGGSIPSEAAAQSFNNDNAGYRTARSVITITAPENAAGEPVELTVEGIADTPQGPIVRRARGPGMVVAVRGQRQRAFTAPWLDLELPMAVSKPLPVTLTGGAPQVRMSQGFEYQLSYRVQRGSGTKPAGRVRNQQAGAVGNIRILQGPPGKGPDAGSILVSTNFDTPVTTFDIILETTAETSDGKPVTITSPAISIEVVQGFQLKPDQNVLRVEPGGRFEVHGHIFREPTFEGSLVQIKLEDLPDKVTCDTTEAPGGERHFTLSCEAKPGAPAGASEVRLVAVAPDTGRTAKDTYKIPSVPLKLTVTGTTTTKASR